MAFVIGTFSILITAFTIALIKGVPDS